ALSVCQTYSRPELLSKFKPDGSDRKKLQRSDLRLRKLSEFELILELNSTGWTHEYQKPSRKLKPYERDGNKQKTWYYHKASNYRYLLVLVLAEELFAEGLERIHHGQPVSYYSALLAAVGASELNAVLPWQTKSFYSNLIKLFKQQQHGIKSKQRRAPPALQDDEPGLAVPGRGECTADAALDTPQAVTPDVSKPAPATKRQKRLKPEKKCIQEPRTEKPV
ncbi:unnamed protein product, partial [Durusdinium trenchii]